MDPDRSMYEHVPACFQEVLMALKERPDRSKDIASTDRLNGPISTVPTVKSLLLTVFYNKSINLHTLCHSECP